ncbi:D-alanyl-D-alanine dipeptidase [Maribacter aquivivus]|uniref:D-alanyl-D-alanine dipeptidase n=1 Tax=Maribacter aquivivus TaxID=228958 RepID=A0A1M6S4U1_9FLAO|nr:M15 family metallopeptidase [Maribacter aquivivus]SHK39854.1 D-alanyl-D-alanine dipeptidase [Maribacter aquivivus]
MFKNRIWGLLLTAIFMFTLGCKEEVKNTNTATNAKKVVETVIDSIIEPKVEKPVFKSLEGIADTTFVRLADYSDGFAYDLRYATDNNFLKEQVYDCGECYTRAKTVKALLKANEEFKKHGVKIKFYDCYRPNSVQYKMWKIVPNPQYVANPVKGSIHNKGGAVDITLVTLDDEEVKMPSDFDFFGKRAYHDNFDLPQDILDNRKLLKETMEKYGFWSTRTEWWHYNLQGASHDPIANFKWDCE